LEALDLPCLRRRVGKSLLHLHMETIRESNRIVPLFKMRVRSDETATSEDAKSDYGIFCAQQAGVNDAVLKRANEIFQCLQESKSIVPWTLSASTAADPQARYDDMLRNFLKVDSWLTCSDAAVDAMMRRL